MSGEISPEQQLANVRESLADLRRRRPQRGDAQAIRDAERQLAEMEAQHRAGELRPIPADGLPF